MRPLRILHILEATGGGTKRHLLELVQGTDRDLITHFIACPRQRHSHSENETIIPELIKAGIEYRLVDMMRTLHPWYDLKAFIQLVYLLNREHFDLIHVHSSKAGFLGRVAARLSGQGPVIYTPHGLYFLGQRGWRRHFYQVLERLAGYLTDCVIAVSASEKATLIEAHIVPHNRIFLIENGIDIDDYEQPTDPKPFRRQLGLPEHGPIVGTVSRFAEQKNPEMIFQVASHLILTVPEVHFVWCGDGELRAKYEQLASSEKLREQLHITGFCADVRRVLSSLDVFITASHFEGLPYSVLEAMSLGLPVVATDAVGLRDIILHNQTGLLTRPESAEELGEAVSELLTDPARRKVLGQAGRTLVAQHFTLRESLHQTQILYDNMANGYLSTRL